ncbi:MAG TPA: matrixin family metalloprotease [Chthoniobacterales bacterium]|nr:matrixin family metalloprotease [Chthoniobacterales bacterium]
MFSARIFLFAALLVFLGRNADAFVREFNDVGTPGNPMLVPIEWNKDRTVLMHLSLPASPPLSDGFASFNDSARDALNIWNQNLVHMQFAVNKNSIVPPSDTDANTSVIMTNTIYGMLFGDGVLAVTLVTPRNNHFIEADVVFNATIEWDSYRGPLRATMDFHRVALHEFGHVVGLDHPDQAKPKQFVSAIMNSTISYVDSLQSDDINGGHSIYDTGPDYQSSVPAPDLLNLSTRAFVGLGENALIGGFIVQGSQPATVIVRGIGYSLPAVGITDALKDPVIELHSASGSTLATSDDWIDDSWASTIASYHLDPSNSRESAILTSLNPGSYTVVVRSFDNGDGHLTGTAVVELFDLHTTGGRAGNISTRGQVLGNGSQLLIGGFIVGGAQSKTVVVRAIGPSLSAAGINHPLNDPLVELHDGSGATLASNDNWQSGPNAAQIQSENLAPSQPSESALQATLNPGSYTAIVRSANGTDGVALVEVYDLSPAPN